MSIQECTAGSFLEALSQLAIRAGSASSRTITFWCGAGFSKAWSPDSPTEGSLFSIPKDRIEKFTYFRHVLNAMGWENNDRIGFEGFKTLLYVLDMQLKYPDIRNRYLDEQNLRFSINEVRTFVQQHFETLGELNYINPATQCFPMPELRHGNMQHIIDFFKKILSMSSMDRDADTGLRPQFITTNYDYTIETILNQATTQQQSILNRIYRGISPEYICGQPAWQQKVENYDYSLIKLNGGFEILSSGNRYNIDYRQRSQPELQEDPPVLILPSREQDYSDTYFQAIFPKSVRILRESQILIVIGYSMPREDALLLFILRQFAESGIDAQGKHIYCIDLKGSQILERRLRWNFNSITKSGWPKVHFYTGGFESFCNLFNQCS